MSRGGRHLLGFVCWIGLGIIFWVIYGSYWAKPISELPTGAVVTLVLGYMGIRLLSSMMGVHRIRALVDNSDVEVADVEVMRDQPPQKTKNKKNRNR